MSNSHLQLFGLLLGLLALLGQLSSCNSDEMPAPDLEIKSLLIGNHDLLSDTVVDAAINQPIIVTFNLPLDTTAFLVGFHLIDQENQSIQFKANFFNNNQSVTVYPITSYQYYQSYVIQFGEEIKDQTARSKFTPLEFSFITQKGILLLEDISINDVDLDIFQSVFNVPVDFTIIAKFSDDINPASLQADAIKLLDGNKTITFVQDIQGSQLIIQPKEKTDYYTTHTLQLTTKIEGMSSAGFEGFEKEFKTGLDSTMKFPQITDEELLTAVQEQTFKYFWDFGHPTSGLARERNTSGETVTIGGSGFGVMSILVGIERGFITRSEGIERLLKIVNFLYTKADRFHGVWPHWLDGSTGKTRPFSTYDNGGDLVETAFMIQGLLTVRQYLDPANSLESELISKINILWESVEWDWYTQGGQNVLYWHWSPNYNWQMNMKIAGWNEALIVYVLAAASTTHSIDPVVYQQGWARNGSIKNTSNNSFYGYQLDMRSDRGGPLFFSHYSFLGLDPRNLSDQYANYWNQNQNHSLINQAYCELNPRKFIGYSAQSWGLTASDGYNGYNAHSPDNDKGVITPTAALSSFPYTPGLSMDALHHFYYVMGDKLWGEYGFYDAFDMTNEWVASSYLAIDQGPIIIMIENHRSALLWDLFMSAPEVQQGLDKLGFTY